MINKLSIEQANPFIGHENIISSIEDIKTIHSKVEFKSDKGLIVTLSNNDSSILLNTTIEDLELFDVNDAIDIYVNSEGIAFKDEKRIELYKKIISQAIDGTVFKANVVEATAKGLLVSIDGLECFMPLGQIGIEANDELQNYIGSIIDVKLISIKLYEKEANRFLPIVSHKIINDEKINIESQDKLHKLEVGLIVQGTVKSIAKYGVFVNLFPSIDGLIHITDLSWERVVDPADIVSVGEVISVVILDKTTMNNGKNKISLGLKQLTQKPWKRLDKNSKAGDVVSGIISNIVDYGVFITLPSGVQGLVHKTELSWNSKVTSRDFQIGQCVSAQILSINWEEEKILLSIKNIAEDPWSNIDKYSVGQIVDVSISRFVNFGAFVNIEEGIEGLIHVSELTWIETKKKPKELFQLGEILQATILSIDKENKKIELSHKRLLHNPWLDYNNEQPVRASIVEIVRKGMYMQICGDNLRGFIPKENITEDKALQVNDILDCVVKEIDENKKIIILAIV